MLADEEAPTLVIDAGHGGSDGGAVSVDGRPESGINLDIALKTESLCRLFGVKTVMTRRSEVLDYPEELRSIREKKVWDQKDRVSRINSISNAVLLSIHQNTYPDPRPNGVQVLYGTAAGSKEWATLTQDNLMRSLCPDSRRVAAPASEKIYLLKNIHCPAILAECGFLSNAAEAEKLATAPYQCTVALLLTASCLQYFS